MLPYYDQLKHWALRDDMRGFDCLGAEEWFPAPTLAAVRGGVASIKRGQQGDSVMYVQGLAGAVADGKFGEATEKAVKAFQKSRNLPTTGVVDFSTLTMLDVLAQGGTAGVEKIDFSAPSSAPRAPSAPSTPTAPSSSSTALVPVASVVPNWWTQPAWQGTNMKRWQVATAGAGGTLVLGGLFAWLVGSAARTVK